MTVTNVSTYAALQSVLSNVSTVQNELNNDQIEISSGQSSQNFAGLGGGVDEFVSLNAQVARLQNFQQDNSVTLSQLNSSNTALGQIQQIATSLQSLIAEQTGGAGSGSASTASFEAQLLSSQTSLISELNTMFGGKYVFGGTDTNTPPVSSTIPTPQQIGVPEDSYYQGSSQDTTTRIGDGQVLTNSVRADNISFQQIFAGIKQALAAGGNSTQLQAAENLVQSGLQGVNALQATVNSNIVNVQDTNTQSQSFQSYYQSLTETMSQSDVVSLSTQVAQDQSVLEATFETYSRISSLSLANYIGG